MLRSRRTSAVLLATLVRPYSACIDSRTRVVSTDTGHSRLQDTPHLADSLPDTTKLTHVDYAGDSALFRTALLPPSDDGLLAQLRRDVADRLAVVPEAFTASEDGDNSEQQERPQLRSVVVVLDSLNALLEQASLQQVLLFVHELQQEPRVGSVVARVTTSAVSSGVRHVLASEATAVVQVETQASLSAYPILSKERRREVPKTMNGLVLLQRQKNVRRPAYMGIRYKCVGAHSLSLSLVCSVPTEWTQ